ncbi:TPA: ParB/Srx family N-terminal domain-containing protein [Burkholderia cenocepacia]
MTRAKFKLCEQVPVQDLLLDVGNARIRHGLDQGDCIQRILRKEAQLIALMRDIAEEGLSTAPILVSPAEEGKWIVRDGNRRITALKLLANPDYASEARVRNLVAGIAQKYPSFPRAVDVLSCDDPVVIRQEMLKRHSGALNGVGQLDWSTYLRTIFRLNGDEPDPNKRAGQYAMWAEDEGIVVDDDFPLTTLSRIATQENLLSLGFRTTATGLEREIPLDSAKRLASRIIDDLTAKKIKVDDVFTPAAAKAYIASTKRSLGISEPDDPAADGGARKGTADDGSKAGDGGRTGGVGGNGSNPKGGDTQGGGDQGGKDPEPDPAGDGAGGSDGVGRRRGPGTARKQSWERKCIFPKGNPGFDLPREFIKATTIVTELKRLDTQNTTLAVAVLLRCLVELSVEHYQDVRKLTKRDSLAKNVASLANDFLTKQWINIHQFDTVIRHTQTDGGLLSIKSLQKYVHSPEAHPNQQVINTMWDEIGYFVGQCWRPIEHDSLAAAA